MTIATLITLATLTLMIATFGIVIGAKLNKEEN